MTGLSEAAWQSQVVGIARQYGFECFHPPANRPDARGRKQATAAGWPDLVILGKGRALFVELKSETGRIRPEQVETLRRLAEAGCETAVWRPRDLPAVLASLGPQQQPLAAARYRGTGPGDVEDGAA